METQTEWGILVALYLFFAGIGAGAYIVTAWSEFTSKTHEKKEFRWGAHISWICVAIGTLFLILDVGRPTAAMNIFNVFTNPTSMMAWGAWILTTFIFIGILTSVLWITTEEDGFLGRRLSFLRKIPGFKSRGLRYAVEGVGFIFALAAASYTGLLLGVVRRIPFWNTPLLPPLFLISALTTGLGIVGIAQSVDYYRTKETDKRIPTLEDIMLKVDTTLVAIIILEAIMVLSFVIIMMNGVGAARASAELLLYEEYASVFWSGMALLGLVAPLILSKFGAPHRKTVPFSILGFLSVHLGSFFLRYGILLAGVHVAIL